MNVVWYNGDIYLGVEDDGTAVGVSEKAASEMIKNFIKIISNPNMFQPIAYLEPKMIKYEGKTIIHIHVPPSSEVHSFKKIIYDRVDDADVKVTATSQIAAMYIRKQNIFTEKKIYPYLKYEDLRLDLLARVKQMAVNHAGGKHPWKNMSDEEVLKSAGLYGKDASTGQQGYNLAAAMLLGKDDIILSIASGYRTDALLRKVNIDRYDDRLIVQTNLIESYDQLMGFAEKHLWDKFFLEDDKRVSIRNIIAREMLVNTLIHREMTSSYIAKFVIEKDRMFVENANRAVREGIMTPDDFEPNPKNPIIASFFRNIGLSDQLGSGVRNLFKYGKLYSGLEPEMIEGDVFKIIVPLNDEYSFDFNKKNKIGDKKSAIKISDKKSAIKISDKKTSAITKANYEKILDYMEKDKEYKTAEIAEAIGLKPPQTRRI
ncbi:RNA-binding domain-containing protein [Anaerosporobacter sp.]|uniref:RNA-binding domain-containing protein n=1 Tax=Anaerosporobacter sp. TaxID=1872529 RepID=UPI00286EBE93|nr:RNA-binding domain-containing protein [Anaerosporobacter sp.]